MQASAVIETKTVVRMVEQTEAVRVVTLTITEAEAETVALMMRAFVASDHNERSKHVQALRSALKDAGIAGQPGIRIDSFLRPVYAASNGFPNRSSLHRMRNPLPTADEFRLMFKERV